MPLVGQLFDAFARFGDRPAIVDDRWRLRYADLAEISGKVARWFHQRYPEPTTVALLLPNSAEYALAFCGLVAAGHTVLPVNFLLKPDELLYILKDAAPRALIAARMFRPVIEKLRPALPDLNLVLYADQKGEDCMEGEHSYEEILALPDSSLPAVAIDPVESVAVLLYTSGTMGKPKGVMLSHENLASNVQACCREFHVDDKDIFLATLPLFHTFAITATMLLPLACGSKLVIQQRFHPKTVFEAIASQRITVMLGVPSMFGLMVKVPWPDGLDTSCLRVCIAGGEPLAPVVGDAFLERFGTRLNEGYGATECSPVITVTPEGTPMRRGSAGLALSNLAIAIRDDQGKVLPVGEIGEITVRGPSVMKGYRAQPAATTEVLDSDGWYKTGDLGHVDEEGYLFITGRKKELIISAGKNIYPKEIEDVLLAMPEVIEAAVVGIQDATRGEAPLAFVAFAEGKSVKGSDIRAFCRERLADYKVPRKIEVRPELPKTLTGKIFKRKLYTEEGLAGATLDGEGRLISRLKPAE